MSNRFNCAVTAAALFLVSCLPASASFCRRHFYNNSNFPWFVMLTTPNGCGNGSIFMQTCKVAPHSTLALHYNSITPASAITIRSQVYNRVFVVTIDCKIQHSGRTGNASVNDPANGDVSTCRGKC